MIHNLHKVECKKCGVSWMVSYKTYWARKKNKSKLCFKCSRMGKGTTNGGSFTKGIVPWNKGVFTALCRICGKRIKNSKRCRECWMKEVREKNSKSCVICGKIFSKYGKFCSRDCFKQSKVWVKRGKEHPSWKGGKWRWKCIDCGEKKSRSAVNRCRKCLDKYKVGELHHSWQGGKSSENIKIRRSVKYREWRTAVFKKDNYTCVFCKARGGRLNADHIKRFALYPELRLVVSNGRTLCVPCHKATETWGTKGLRNRKYKLINLKDLFEIWKKFTKTILQM